MMTSVTGSVRFSADKNTKRIRQFHKHLEKQKVQEHKQLYLQSLEQFTTNPERVLKLMDKAIYIDQQGDFTGKDLLEFIAAKLKKKKMIDGIAVGVAVVTIVPLVVFAESTNRKEVFHLKEQYIVDSFPPKVRSRVAQTITEMKALGLVDSIPGGWLTNLTQLGKLMLKNTSTK